MLRRPAILLALSLLASPASASGFTHRDYANYCTTGAFVTCASVQITAFAANGHTLVTIRIANLQGSHWADNTHGSAIGLMDFRVPCPTEACNTESINAWSGPTARGTAQAIGIGPTSGVWDVTLGSLNPPYVDNVLNPDAGPYGPTGIEGCTAMTSLTAYYRTCGPTGWVELTFDFQSQFRAGDVFFYWLAYHSQPGDPYVATADCSFAAGTGHSNCVQITPEPATLLLTATGLAGIGGAVRRRRGWRLPS